MKEQSRGNSALCFSKIQKNFGKSLKNPLTASQNCGIITTKDEGKENPQKPERNLKMKKATLQFISTYLSENAQYADEIEKSALDAALLEINAELNKGQEQKDKNAQAYESIHSLIVDTLSDTPVTCGELWDAIQNDVPDGITKGKVQYALTHLWQDEIVKIEGKPNTYRRA